MKKSTKALTIGLITLISTYCSSLVSRPYASILKNNNSTIEYLNKKEQNIGNNNTDSVIKKDQLVEIIDNNKGVKIQPIKKGKESSLDSLIGTTVEYSGDKYKVSKIMNNALVTKYYTSDFSDYWKKHKNSKAVYLFYKDVQMQGSGFVPTGYVKYVSSTLGSSIVVFDEKLSNVGSFKPTSNKKKLDNLINHGYNFILRYNGNINALPKNYTNGITSLGTNPESLETVAVPKGYMSKNNLMVLKFDYKIPKKEKIIVQGKDGKNKITYKTRYEISSKMYVVNPHDTGRSIIGSHVDFYTGRGKQDLTKAMKDFPNSGNVYYLAKVNK